MSGLLAFLLRNGAGLLKDGAEVLIGQALIRAVTQRLKGILLFYAVIAVFALAALVFFYVLLYRVLSSQLGDVGAAAILCGTNLLLILLMFTGKALFRPRPVSVTAASPIVELIKSQVEGISTKDMNFDAGIAIGNQIGKHIRKATPQIALAAAVLGLVIGVRPQILGLFRRREPPAKKR
jgi:hypothetical protein